MARKSVYLSSLIGFLIVLLFMVFFLTGIPAFDVLEGLVYDSGTFFFQSGKGGDPGIVLVEIGGRGAKEKNAGAFSRREIADLIGVLNRNGAALIGLQMPLSERKTSRELLDIKTFREMFETISLRSKDNELKALVLSNIKQMEASFNHDRLLIENVEQSGKVILTAYEGFGDDQVGAKRDMDPNLYRDSLARSDLSSSIIPLHSAPGLLLPIPELSRVALGLGHGKQMGAQCRNRISHPLFVSYKGALLPSLPLRVAIATLRMQPNQVLVGKNSIRLGDLTIPTLNGELLVKRPIGEEAFPRLSARDVVQTKESPQAFKGKTVLVGSDTGDRLVHIGGGYPSIPETMFSAHVLSHILNRDFIVRPPWLKFLEILILLAIGGFCSVYFPRMGHPGREAWMGIFTGLALLSGVVLFSAMSVLFRSIYIAACVVTVYLGTSITKHLSSERISKESVETNRLLGLSFQSQGLLDLAFEKFKKLPLDLETKDLIYSLAQEFERKRHPDKAIAAYAYISRGTSYRDAENRIDKLKESDKSSTIGSHKGLTEASVLAESGSEIQRRIGRYEIIEEIGKGAMGLVYKAIDPKINRLLAIKTIRFSDEFDDDVIHEIKERFFREAEIAGQLSHPSIVTIYDVGEEGDLTYMVMEYLEGHDLEKFIRKRNLLPFRRILEVGASVADALEYAHGANVIHRDIKPANIMLLKTGGIKVTDFGIAKAISSSRTKTGVILGTPNYMSPEQIMGQKIDHRSDIFSLGVLFFQLLTGETPFHGDNLSGLLYQITQVKHPSVREYNPKVPRVCEQIIDRALAKNPKERFKNAGEMAKYLRLIALKIDQLSKKKRI